MKRRFFRSAIGCLFAGLSLEAATLTVDQNSDAPGVCRTISQAAAKALPGDEILVRPGIYREHVAPETGGEAGKPIVYRAAEPGKVFLKGSDVWKPELAALPGAPGVYTTPTPGDAFFGAFPNPFKRKLNAAGKDKKLPARPATGELWPYSLGQIFCDGIELRQSQTEQEARRIPGSWILNADGSAIMLHLPSGTEPGLANFEITVRDRVFAPARRGLGFIELEGFVFEHCANQAPFPQLGMVSTRSGHDWVIRNNVIRHAKTVGLDVGSEYWSGDQIPRTTPDDQKLIRKGGRHLVTGNLVVDNGLSGIAGWSCRGIRIIGNVVERNNNLSLTTNECDWEEWAGIKLHEADNALVEGNLVRFNGAHGIWFDNGYNNARITRNVLFCNVGSGVFVELGAGQVTIDNNIIANTTPYSSLYPGRGVYAHDASGVRVFHNLIVDNAAEGVYMHNVTDRKYHGKLVETSNAAVANNIFCNNGGGVSLPFPGDRSENCVSGPNLFIGKVDFRYSGKTPWEKVGEKLTPEELDRATATKSFAPEVWPKLSGRESTSVFLPEREFGVRMKPFEPALYLHNRSGKVLEFAPIPGIDRDFTGQGYGPNAFPGPIQDIGKQNHYRLLFPVM